MRSDIDNARLALASAEAFILHTVDSLPLHLAVLGADTELLFVNESWRVFGETRGAASSLGQKYAEVCRRSFGDPRSAALEIAEALEALAQGRKTEHRCDYSMTHGSETTWWSARFTRFTTGELIRIVTVHEEITERVVALRGLELAHAEAQRASRAQGVFLAAVTHEVRTPLHAILGFTDLALGSTELSPALRADLASVEQGGRRLLDLVNRIFELSELESGALALAPGPVLLDSLVEDLRSGHQAAAESKGLRWGVRVTARAPVAAHLDFMRVRQLVGSLLDYAIRSTEAGEIRVLLDYRLRGRNEGDLVITVRDTGPGLPPGLQRLLEPPFGLGEEVGALPEATTGLDLALADALARRLGGTLMLEPAQPHGTVATVTIPTRAAGLSSPWHANRTKRRSAQAESALFEPGGAALDDVTLARLEKAALAADFATLDQFSRELSGVAEARRARIRAALEEFDYAAIRREVAALRATNENAS